LEQARGGCVSDETFFCAVGCLLLFISPQGGFMSKARVLIVDGNSFCRDGLARWIEQQPGLACCGCAESAQEIRRELAAHRPELIIMDLRLRDCDGLDILREISDLHPTGRVLVFSELEEQVFAHRAIRAGARGYVMKSQGSGNLAAAIEAVIRGELWLSRAAAALALDNLFPDRASPSPGLARLSDRELQIFRFIGAGLRSKEIAAKLNISPKTVDTHRENLKLKLNLKDGESLTLMARRWIENDKLVLPEPPRSQNIRSREARG
jgi:DNA-binding NarL/FixJ family response regulator